MGQKNNVKFLTVVLDIVDNRISVDPPSPPLVLKPPWYLNSPSSFVDIDLYNNADNEALKMM